MPNDSGSDRDRREARRASPRSNYKKSDKFAAKTGRDSIFKATDARKRIAQSSRLDKDPEVLSRAVAWHKLKRIT